MPLPMIPASAAIELLKALALKIASLGGQVLGNEVLASIDERLTRRDVTRAIKSALQAAVDRFEKTMQKRNKAMLQAIEAQPNPWTNPALYPILADAIVHPERRNEQVEQLTTLFAPAAPTLPQYMVEEAARILIESLYLEVLNVTAFHKRLEEVRDRVYQAQMGALDLPQQRRQESANLAPLAPGLRKALVDAGSALAHELGINYIGTAHLFYGLSILDGSVSSGVLEEVGITPDQIREAVRKRVKPDSNHPIPELTRLRETEAVTHAFTLAQAAAAQEGEDEANDEHVLEALLDQVDRGQEDGKSMRAVLDQLPVTTATIRPLLADVHSVVGTLSSIVG